jgi:hypothetical protein
MSRHTITFIPSGRGKAQCAPDPMYPNGKVVNPYPEGVSCKVDLPYPAPECGYFCIDCSECGLKVMVTAAGRPDDPLTVFIPCAKATACQQKGGTA